MKPRQGRRTANPLLLGLYLEQVFLSCCSHPGQFQLTSKENFNEHQHNLNFSSISLNNVALLLAHSWETPAMDTAHWELQPALPLPWCCCQLSHCQKGWHRWHSLQSPARGGQGFLGFEPLSFSFQSLCSSQSWSHCGSRNAWPQGYSIEPFLAPDGMFRFSLSFLVMLRKRRQNTAQRAALHPGASSAKTRDWEKQGSPCRLMDIDVSRRAGMCCCICALTRRVNGPPGTLQEEPILWLSPAIAAPSSLCPSLAPDALQTFALTYLTCPQKHLTPWE